MRVGVAIGAALGALDRKGRRKRQRTVGLPTEQERRVFPELAQEPDTGVAGRAAG